MSQCSSASPAVVLSVAELQLKTALCSSGLLPQQAVRVSLPAPVRDSAPGLGTPQPVTPAACVALAALRKTVVGADKGPSDLMGHCLGLHTVDQLLEVPKWPLPAAQLDRATMPRPQPLSDNVLYAAAATLGTAHRGALEDFWSNAEHPLASMYRLVMARHYGPHPRTQALPTGAEGVEGGRVGLSQSASRVPYCSSASAANCDLVRLIRRSLPPAWQHFSFTTVQVNKGLRPKPHRDSANVGESLCVSLGPFTGGLMWQTLGQEALVFERDVRFLPPWTWGPMDGTCVHSCTPHFGQRVSLHSRVRLAPLARQSLLCCRGPWCRLRVRCLVGAVQ
jgi:hypothetical protein